MKKKPQKKSAKKRKRKPAPKKRWMFMLLRQLAIPLFLLLLVCFSLAATFYLVFLHTPEAPFF